MMGLRLRVVVVIRVNRSDDVGKVLRLILQGWLAVLGKGQEMGKVRKEA